MAAILTDRQDVKMDAMVRALRHRGPDGAGVLSLPGCHLGHARLSIIDRVGGAQPMSDDTGRFHVVFNGEIYNHRELRRELERSGARFRTSCDTEVLLLACREWGDAAVHRLNGQFAFAVWDARDRRLLAARDRLGEKPLYFAQTARGELLLASEIKALLATGWLRPTIDPAAVQAYLQLNYVPPCMTIYQNVGTLGPGQALGWHEGRIQRWSYWSPRISTLEIGVAEAAGEVRRLLEAAVARQMVADTAVGAFLSGGLDSTTIVALMSRESAFPVRTFAAGFGELINELPFARAVASRYGTRHAEMDVRIDVADQLERMAAVYDEPFGDSSNIPTCLISEFARRDVKVVLSGDGGDELFGGYAWYRPLLSHDELPVSLAACWARRLEAKACQLLSALGLPLTERQDRARAAYREMAARRSSTDAWQRHVSSLGSLPDAARRRLGWRDEAALIHSLATHYRPDPALRAIDRAVDFDVRCYLPGDILVKVDRAAMAHGLETRSPFLDVELVEFVLSLPARVRFEGRQLKPLLRRACQDLWPGAVRQRGKQGFGAPLKAWLAQPRVQELRRRVLGPRSPLAEVVPLPARWPQYAARYPQAEWNLLCLGLWLEHHCACLDRLQSAA